MSCGLRRKLSISSRAPCFPRGGTQGRGRGAGADRRACELRRIRPRPLTRARRTTAHREQQADPRRATNGATQHAATLADSRSLVPRPRRGRVRARARGAAGCSASASPRRLASSAASGGMKRFVLLSGLGLALAAEPAHACSCAGTSVSPTSASCESSLRVFAGTVDSTRAVIRERGLRASCGASRTAHRVDRADSGGARARRLSRHRHGPRTMACRRQSAALRGPTRPRDLARHHHANRMHCAIAATAREGPRCYGPWIWITRGGPAVSGWFVRVGARSGLGSTTIERSPTTPGPSSRASG